MEYRRKEWIKPFILAGLVIFLDQLTKAIVVRNWPIMPNTYNTFIKDVFGNDFLVFNHVRNKAIAFSIGTGFPPALQTVLFIVLPLGVLAFLVWYYFNTTEFTRLQRWTVAGIIGGGIGNIIDRIFRSDGVVDFVSVRFYGVFGLDRWPTFNVADSSVVICCIILIVSMIFGKKENITSDEVSI